MPTLEDRTYSIEEYFSLVEELDYKIEYHKGKIFAMAGGSSEHNLIATNVTSQLNNALAEKDCYVYNSDQRLAILSDHRYLYPDAMVVCGDREFADEKRLMLINPMLIVEVLSPSTTDYDRSGKFHLYGKVSSFKEYLLVHSDRVFVEAFYRENSDLWRISSAFRLDQNIHLYSLGLDLPLENIYRKIDGLKEESFV